MALYPWAAQIGLGGLFMKMEEEKKRREVGSRRQEWNWMELEGGVGGE